MTRCEAYWNKVRKLLEAGDEEALREFCDKSSDMIRKIVDHLRYSDEHLNNTMVLSERSTRLLRKLQRKEPELHAEVLELVCDGVEPREAIRKVKIARIEPIEARKDVRIADIREITLSAVDLILTDPPYPEQYLPLWRVLFEKSLEGLKEGGFLVNYTPHIYLPEIFEMVPDGLNYVWTIAQVHRGAKTAYHPSRVNIGWKPILVFVKGKIPEIQYFNDVLMGQGREKANHEWQQALGESEELIKAFCPENGLVVDPFVGSGTTALAARNTERNFLVSDIDPLAYQSTLRRLKGD